MVFHEGVIVTTPTVGDVSFAPLSGGAVIMDSFPQSGPAPGIGQFAQPRASSPAASSGAPTAIPDAASRAPSIVRPLRDVPRVPVSTAPASAVLTVQVPQDARIFVDDHETQQRGATRRFASPPITRDREFSYALRVEVTRNGRTVVKTQDVKVRGGAQSLATFSFTDPNESELVARVR